ncbi:MAG: hypothetical protein WCV85_00590 [Patescibacteria group bacterium]
MENLENLQVLREQARTQSQLLEQAEDALTQTINEYNQARRSHFDKEFKRKQLFWCTECHEIFKGEGQLILLEGVREESCGYENSCYRFDTYSELHQTCPSCYQKALDRHGWVGTTDSQLHKTPRYHAFRVETRSDGLFACRFGEWQALNPEMKVPAIWDHVIEKLCNEWKLPPKLEIKFGRLKDPEWIVAGEPV